MSAIQAKAVFEYVLQDDGLFDVTVQSASLIDHKGIETVITCDGVGGLLLPDGAYVISRESDEECAPTYGGSSISAHAFAFEVIDYMRQTLAPDWVPWDKECSPEQ